MYKYNCMVCEKDFPSNVIPEKIKHRICAACIITYVKVGRYFRDLKEELKSEEYAIETN